MKLGVIMDPIESIHIKKDSTFAMLLEAQKRQWSIFYMEQKDLLVRDGVASARMRTLEVFDDEQKWFAFKQDSIQTLANLDVILMRKDPPVDAHYLYTTQLLELAERAGVLVVNKPQALRDCNEKLFTTWFPQCCPPSLITHVSDAVKDFLVEQGDIICKPLHGMGGASIFRLRPNDPNISVVLETLTQQNTQLMMAQRYIPEIKQGDKRILMINGEPIPYALARMAAPGETRANLAAGGTGVGVELSQRDKWICEQVGPILREKGLWFVGLDVIGDYLTEINVTSPTCIRELDKLFNLNVSQQLFDAIVKKASKN
jgi:glutathione synthase